MSIRVEKDRQILVAIDNYLNSMPDYMENFVNSLTSEGKTMLTIKMYLSALKGFLRYVKKKRLVKDIKDMASFNSIKPMHINNYLASKKCGERTKATSFFAIKSFFRFMADNDYIEKNVCEKVVLKSVKPIADITYLTDEEVKTVFTGILKDKNVMDYDHLDVFGMRDYLIIALGIDTGIRKGSITEIELKDIDLQNGRLSLIQKGNKELVLELGEHIIEMINKYLVKRQEYLDNHYTELSVLFYSRRLQPLSQSTVTQIVDKWANIFPGKHITPHKLRSTCATLLYGRTGDIYATADRLGHSNVNTTKRYAAITDEKKKKTATALTDLY